MHSSFYFLHKLFPPSKIIPKIIVEAQERVILRYPLSWSEKKPSCTHQKFLSSRCKPGNGHKPVLHTYCMKKSFLPAAHYDFLTPCYDVFIRRFFGGTFRKIARTIDPAAHEKILDMGCGPGNLIVAIKSLEPKAEVTGLDIDPKILDIARRKLSKNRLSARIIEASAIDTKLTEKFDVVVSTLMIHHLSAEDKEKMIGEAHRLLKDGGRFYLYDFGPPRGVFGKVLAALVGFFEPVEDGVKNRYRIFMEKAGFQNIRSLHRSRLFELLEGWRRV